MSRDNKKLVDDCFDPEKPRLLHKDALSRLKSIIAPVTDSESVPLTEALGRILYDSVLSPISLPPQDNSAVDGFGFDSSTYEETGGWYPVVARIPAGHPANLIIHPGASVRIFTGAIIPAGIDTVVMQEDCEAHEQDGESYVIIPPGLSQGANIRKAGEDVQKNDTVLPANHRIRAQDVARLASLGFESINVRKRLRVALLSTGDEIKPQGEALSVGDIYNANTPLLTTLLQNLPVEIVEARHLPDDEETVETHIRRLADQCDLVLTTGGASLGEEDYIAKTLDKLGSRYAWQLAIKPGRPMVFGQIGSSIFMGLPGNPVAVLICYLLYVYPALFVLCGGNWRHPTAFKIPANFDMKKKAGRREFLRGILEYDDEGKQKVRKYARDGSGLIQGLVEANGLIELPEDCTKVKPGDLVDFLPFENFGIGHS